MIIRNAPIKIKTGFNTMTVWVVEIMDHCIFLICFSNKKKPMRIKYSQKIVTDNAKQSPSTVDCGLSLVNYAEYISRRNQ